MPPSDRQTVASVDSHAHVFVQGLSLADSRRYRPEHDATLEHYLALLDANAISHGVLVQPSFLGTDNGYLLDALRQAPQRLRGVVVVDPSVSAGQLEAMTRAGVVGMRLNLIGLAAPQLDDPAWQALLSTIDALGWHVEVHLPAGRLQEVVPTLLDTGCRVVVDHFGRPDAALGVRDPGFQFLLRQADTGRVWVKLSGAYRNWDAAQCADAPREAARQLLSAFGAQRLMWGSDWPHTQHGHVSYRPTREWLDDWIDDPDQRRTLLADTPLRLFQFQRDQA